MALIIPIESIFYYNLLTTMIEPKLLHDYIQTDEAYSKQFDDMVKEETDWWEQQFNKHALYPTEEDIQKTKDLIKKSPKEKKYTDEDVKTEHHRFMQFGGIVASISVQKTWEEKRVKTIAKWKKEAKERNKRILSAIPFDNIKCKKCNILL